MTNEKRKPNPDEPTDIVVRLSAAITTRALTLRVAAAEIGVTLNTLERHIRGEHIRSDSARKYEHWLAGRTTRRRVFRQPTVSQEELSYPVQEEPELSLTDPP